MVPQRAKVYPSAMSLVLLVAGLAWLVSLAVFGLLIARAPEAEEVPGRGFVLTQRHGDHSTNAGMIRGSADPRNDEAGADAAAGICLQRE